MALTLRELANRIGAEFTGDGGTAIVGVSTLQRASPDSISFLANRTYKRYLAETKAAAVILRKDDATRVRCRYCCRKIHT